MSQLSLFGADDDLAPQAARLAPRLASLADRGVHLGTSSWKYPGWVGSIYSADRYQVRGKFSQRAFDSECLAEYARVFSLVGGDFSFYQFPSRAYWARLFGETPETLRFVLKVPEEITVPVWPTHARYGTRSGNANAHFLNADLFRRGFADMLAPYRERVAALIFEFGTYSRRTFATPRDFLERLDAFLAQLPEGLPCAVEVRNPELLGPDYFARLANHGAAHLFNAWTRMPELSEQIALPGAFTADFTIARALLRKGRAYEQAVSMFEPYERVQEPNPSGRDALRFLVAEGLRRKRPTFLLVNNRYEGHAPTTIEAVLEAVEPTTGA